MEISVTPPSVNAMPMPRDCAAMRRAKETCTKDVSTGSDTVSISDRGRALGNAMARAEAATKGASRSELRGIVERTQRLWMDNWRGNASRYAAEVPHEANASRLDIAQRAIRFVDILTDPRKPPAGFERDNPFFGMSRAELATIQYDETGSFTTHERRAAFFEASRQYGEWTAAVCARAREERDRTGKMVNFYHEALAYFEALPAIEQVSLPDGYMDRLRAEVAKSEKDDMGSWATYLNMSAQLKEITHASTSDYYSGCDASRGDQRFGKHGYGNHHQ